MTDAGVGVDLDLGGREAPHYVSDPGAELRIVRFHGHHHEGRRLRAALATVLGGLLLGIGIVASLVAVPLTIGLLLLAILGAGAGGDAARAPAIPWGLLFQTWGEATIATVVPLGLARRLLQGKRRLVLFLRRFGYDDATRAVTVAAASSLGRTWRLVTLDDAAIAPLGVPESTRLVYAAGSHGWSGVRKGFDLTFGLAASAVGLAILAMAAIPMLDWLSRTAASRSHVVDVYRKVLTDLAYHHQLPAPGIDLRFAFVVAIAVAALAIVGYILRLFAAIVWLAFAVPLGLVRATARAVERAERDKRLAIGGEPDIARGVYTVLRDSRGYFAPRLIVVKVAASVWRATVLRFADVSAAILVDVSVPSENLLWEISQLKTTGVPAVFVGEYEQVLPLQSAVQRDAGPSSMPGRLTRALGGREILTYTRDRQGFRRFARELAEALETASSA